jgi:hypothetical protein
MQKILFLVINHDLWRRLLRKPFIIKRASQTMINDKDLILRRHKFNDAYKFVTLRHHKCWEIGQKPYTLEMSDLPNSWEYSRINLRIETLFRGREKLLKKSWWVSYVLLTS